MSKLFPLRCLQRVSTIVSLFLFISFSFSSSQNVEKKICETKECLAAAENFKKSMDFKVDPCHNFYQFACGNWWRNSNEPSTLDSSIMKSNDEIIDFLMQNNSKDEPIAVHKARDFFSLCLNRAAYKNDKQQIDNMLDKIGIPPNLIYTTEFEENFDYTTSLAKVARLTGANPYFDLEIFPNPHNKKADKIRLMIPSYQNNKYKSVKRIICGRRTSTFCKRLLSPSNFAKNLTTEETVKRRWKHLMMKNFAPTSDDYQAVDPEIESVINANLPQRYSLKELQTLTDNLAFEVNSTVPTLNWARYIEEFIIDRENVTVDLSDPNKLQINILNLYSVKETIIDIHIRRTQGRIANEIIREVYNILYPYVESAYSTIMDCTKNIEKFFPWVIYYMFAKKEKYIKAKTEVHTMFDYFRQAFQEHIEESLWMDEMTRQRAIKKLRSMRSHFAFPSTVTNSSILDNFYKDVQITDNFFDTVISLNRHTQLMKDPPDDDFWFQLYSPLEAQYVLETNSIYIPAGYLGFPLNTNGSAALQFGSIGSVIGHEMAHAFENNGRRFNEEGDAEDWWKLEAASLFEDKATCFAQANQNYTETSNHSRFRNAVINRNNLAEDLSDNLGFKESLMAYRLYVFGRKQDPSLPQFENFTQEQLFTLARANVLCETPTISQYVLSLHSSLRQHSAAEFRVNGVFQNSEEFSRIWNCPGGSRMNPIKKCTLW